MGRVLNVIIAGTLLVISIPVLVLTAIAIVLDDGLPVFISQTRVGRDRKPFTLYKFRTMAKDTGDWPSHVVGASSITRFGRIARKLKLDELPQLINVVCGHMKLVGPRPCLPQQEALIMLREKAGVFSVEPGITGLAQIRGIDMSVPGKLVEAETEYLRSASLTFDLKILASTLFGSGLRRDAAAVSKE